MQIYILFLYYIFILQIIFTTSKTIHTTCFISGSIKIICFSADYTNFFAVYAADLYKIIYHNDYRTWKETAWTTGATLLRFMKQTLARRWTSERILMKVGLYVTLTSKKIRCLLISELHESGSYKMNYHTTHHHKSLH